MHELILNTHIHTTYSDGSGTHAQVARAALKTGLDVVITTDHNVYVDGLEGYYEEAGRRLLLMIAEEIHDQVRDPQANHLLVLGANRELATCASDPQWLINQVNHAHGLSFLAHPFEDALPSFGEDIIPWENWEVGGYTGIELWNGLSELKTVSGGKALGAVFYAFFPYLLAHGPLPRTLQKWDELTANGQRVVAICGADAHRLIVHRGPIHKIVFPYEYHFRSINNHILAHSDLSGILHDDRNMVLTALKQGHSFIGYDLPASTRGFRFTAQGRDKTAIMGDEISLDPSVTMQICVPGPAETRLIRNGKVEKTWHNLEICTSTITVPGVYRVECYIPYWGKKRGWIFSNPIYVRG